MGVNMKLIVETVVSDPSLGGATIAIVLAEPHEPDKAAHARRIVLTGSGLHPLRPERNQLAEVGINKPFEVVQNLVFGEVQRLHEYILMRQGRYGFHGIIITGAVDLLELSERGLHDEDVLSFDFRQGEVTDGQ